MQDAVLLEPKSKRTNDNSRDEQSTKEHVITEIKSTDTVNRNKRKMYSSHNSEP